MIVQAIWRYPVKAMLGERLAAAAVGPGGVEGDRRYVVVDVASGAAIGNKRGLTDPRLRACRAALTPDGALRVTLPDGATTLDGPDAAAVALSDLLEREVRLERHAEDGDGAYLRTGAHHDFAPLHLVTTRTLAHLRHTAPDVDWDPRRLRPNLVLDDGDEPGEVTDVALLGRELRATAGGPRLRPGLPTPGCVVPTRAREELPAAPRLLRHLATGHRWELGPFGRPPCLGVYAEVVASGHLAAGERVTVGRASVPPREAAAATVARVAAELGLPTG